MNSPVVYIRSADTGPPDVDQDIVGRGELGDGAVLELDLALLFEYEGKVLRYIVSISASIPKLTNSRGSGGDSISNSPVAAKSSHR